MGAGRATGNAAAIFSLPFLLLLGCTDGEVDKPEPPDLADTVAPYREQTAVLTDESAADAVAALESRLTAGGDLCGWAGVDELLCDGADCPLNGCEGISEALDVLDLLGELEAADAGVPDAGPPDGGTADAGPPLLGDVELVGEGYARIHRICPGALDAPTPDEANGYLEMVVGFTDEGLDPIVWGEAHACVVRVADETFTFDGSVALAVDDRPWELGPDLAPVVVIDAEGRNGSTTVRVRLDLQVDLAERGIALGLELDSGETLEFFARADAKGFRAANGEWACDFGGRTCSDGAGNTVSW